MKKTISVFLAIAMVFVMSLSAFAFSFDDELRTDIEPQGPDDAETWTEFWMDIVEHLATSEDKEADQKQFIEVFVMCVKEGGMSPATAAKVLGAIAMSSVEGLDIPGLIEQIMDAISGELPSDLPSEFPSDITLPSISGGDEEGGNGSFLDTILGAIGGIIDGIFGGGSEEDPTTPAGDGDDDGDDTWGDDDDGFNDQSLGDTSIIAVSAVAVVAGAALVLTRKKRTDDAE